MRRLVSLLCCLVVVTSCGDDATDSTGATQPSTTAAATSLTSAGVVPLDRDPCDLVTVDEVAAAVGAGVAPGRADPPLGCLFQLQDVPQVHIAVIIEDGAGRLGGAAAILDGYRALVADGDAEDVPGLGSAAVYAPGFRGLAVDAGGGRYFAVAVGGGYQALEEPREALVAVARAVLARL